MHAAGGGRSGGACSSGRRRRARQRSRRRCAGCGEWSRAIPRTSRQASPWVSTLPKVEEDTIRSMTPHGLAARSLQDKSIGYEYSRNVRIPQGACVGVSSTLVGGPNSAGHACGIAASRLGDRSLRRALRRQGEREAGRAGVLDSTSSTRTAFNAADVGRLAKQAAGSGRFASAAVNR